MKICVIRFSSFGDIVQAMGILPALKEEFPNAHITWVVKDSFSDIPKLSSLVDEVKVFQSGPGFSGIVELASWMSRQGFDYIYDAHLSLRSRVLCILLLFSPQFIFGETSIIKRPKNRLRRLLLFKFKIQTFPWPFKGRLSYLAPLKRLGIDTYKTDPLLLNFSNEVKSKVRNILKEVGPFVALAPSAAWEMKRWPTQKFIDLVLRFPDIKFVLLGGPQDHFLESIVQASPTNTINLAGKLTLVESCYAVTKSSLIVSADTGLIHIADISATKGISLMGPTAFGHCSGKSIETLEIDLPCRPCSKDGRGKCSQDVYQKCMKEISVEVVQEKVESLYNNH